MEQNGVVSRLSVEKLLSHSAEKFRRVILYCCIFFPVAKKFGWEGEYQDFTSKIFCLTVRKTFVGEFFTVAIIAGTEKVWRREGEYQDFASKILYLTVPKSSVGDTLTVALIFGIEKVWIRVG